MSRDNHADVTGAVHTFTFDASNVLVAGKAASDAGFCKAKSS